MSGYLRAICFLFRKEMLAILKDPASRSVLLLPALLQSLLFGYAATFDLNQASYALLDQSHSAASVELVARLEGPGTFKRVATLQRQSDIAAVIDQEKALLVLVINPSFAVQLAAGAPAPVQLILDARNSNTAGMAAGYVATVVEGFNEDWAQSHGGGHPALSVDARAWYNPNLETRWNLLPGMIASLSVLQTLMLAALSVAREREQGTFDQLLVTPLTPTQIMIGKAIPPVLVGLAQSTIVLLVTRIWFQVPFAGSYLTLYLGLVMFTIASVGVGLSISALSANMQQAMLYSFMLIMPLSLLSGLYTPLRNMPVIMQALTLVNPLRYAVDLVQRVYLEGVGFGSVVSDIWPMILMALVTLPTAAWMFRHRLV
jgi:ABC-2 type transport system permease protein